MCYPSFFVIVWGWLGIESQFLPRRAPVPHNTQLSHFPSIQPTHPIHPTQQQRTPIARDDICACVVHGSVGEGKGWMDGCPLHPIHPNTQPTNPTNVIAPPRPASLSFPSTPNNERPSPWLEEIEAPDNNTQQQRRQEEHPFPTTQPKPDEQPTTTNSTRIPPLAQPTQQPDQNLLPEKEKRRDGWNGAKGEIAEGCELYLMQGKMAIYSFKK